MAGNKYISVGSGGTETEVAASQTSAGAGSAGQIVALNPSGKIDPTMLESDSSNSIISFENMTAPAIVNVLNDSGPKVQYADASAASASKRAHGYIKDSVVAPAEVSVYFGEGDIISGYVGLTPGATYFLSNSTPGGITLTPVTAAGHILQKAGVAVSATEFKFEPEDPIIRA